MKRLLFLLTLTVFLSSAILAQEQRVRWKRKSKRVKTELELFHSTHSINLPTAETLQKGDFEFEISHRFIPPITEGSEALYGIDGPVNMRLGLGYAPTNRMIVTLARSNVEDNVDLQIKYKAVQIRKKKFPFLIALQGGLALNTGTTKPIESNSDKFQFYARFVANTLLLKKIGIGIAPSYLYNSHIYCLDTQYSFTFGSYLQYYVSSAWSILAELNPTVTGWRSNHNSVAFGVELETGGHFFKIILTNNALLNPSQFMSGADLPFDSGDWRLGFNITRLLHFRR